jgi:hypothetical protein
LIDVSAGLRTGEVQKVVDRCLCRADDWGDEEETKYRDWVREQTARRGDQADFSGNATHTLKGLGQKKRFLKNLRKCINLVLKWEPLLDCVLLRCPSHKLSSSSFPSYLFNVT